MAVGTIREDHRRCFLDERACNDGCKAYDLGSSDCRILQVAEELLAVLTAMALDPFRQEVDSGRTRSSECNPP